MHKRILIFIAIIILMTLIPVILFPRNITIEDAQYRLSIELFKNKRYSDAIKEFKRLLYEYKTRKYRDKCLFYIGEAYFNLKKYKQALYYLTQLYIKYPANKFRHVALYHIGRLNYLMGDYKTAIKYFDKYLKYYPSKEYADNSMYWKAEAYLNIGKRETAKKILSLLLKRYPYGNKADAARFKLKLLKIEEEKKVVKTAGKKITAGKTKEEVIIPEDYATLKSDLRGCLEREYNYKLTISQYKGEIAQYKKEIERLNDKIDSLSAEVENLREIGKGTSEEIQKQIEEKVRAFIAWENMLKIKEKALNEKEKKLNEGFEKLYQIQQMIEKESK